MIRPKLFCDAFAASVVQRTLILVAILAACLPTARAADVPAWQLVWADEFNQADGSAPNSSSWAYDLGGGGWGNLELQSYTSRRANSRIENGCLVIEARRETYTGGDGIKRDYTSARLKTEGKRSWTYGRIEARIRMTASQGLWPAFWMLGNNISTVGWPACGEIDIMENIGREPSRMHVALHGTGYNGGDNIGSSYNLQNGARFADDFHLFAVEWEPSRIRWYVDNRLFFTATPALVPADSQWLFDGRPFFLILNVAVGGRWPGSPDATTLLPQQLKVDFVRVYRRANAAPATLRITTVPGGTQASWAATFPQARLQQAADPGAPWLDVPTDGVRVGNEFVVGVTPGFYRLVWTE